MIFNRLTTEQVNYTHILFGFLRKLKVIGVVRTNTEPVPLTEFGKPARYKLVYMGYDASMKNKLTPEEALTELFRESERLGLYDDTSSEPLGSCRQHDSD